MERTLLDATLEWFYRCHRSPETAELFSRVIDWELAFFLADADLNNEEIRSAKIAARFDQTTQTARNRLRKLRDAGVLADNPDQWFVTNDFRALMDKYLRAMLEHLSTTGVIEYLPSPYEPRHLLDALIQANDLQRSGRTEMTGIGWIVLVEIAYAQLHQQTVDATHLAAACRCSLNTLTAQLNAMADRELVASRPSPNDKRRKIWELAGRGRVEVEDYSKDVFEYLKAAGSV